MERVAVVGAGIIGLAVARELQRRNPAARVEVIEKEPAVATHQTGRNSGVVHAGLYYPPGSLKAQLCRRGVGLLRQYCDAADLPYRECGKVVVALTEPELPLLDAIADRAKQNGVPGLRMLDRSGIADVEPHATGLRALHSPSTAIVDFRAVSEALARDLQEAGGVLRLGEAVTGLDRRGSRIRVTTAASEVDADLVVTCAGLQSDRVAQLSGDGADPRIVPFRGQYHTLVPEARGLVRGLIYPVPDPRYPFLGVHLTLRVDDEVLVGPNAFLAVGREAYRLRDASLRDIGDALAWPGFRALARTHWRTGATELRLTLSRRAFAAAAARYVPDIRAAHLAERLAGNRAQALAPDGSLVDDFRITGRDGIVHIRNAPSPGATSSLAIAEHIADHL